MPDRHDQRLGLAFQGRTWRPFSCKVLLTAQAWPPLSTHFQVFREVRVRAWISLSLPVRTDQPWPHPQHTPAGQHISGAEILRVWYFLTAAPANHSATSLARDGPCLPAAWAFPSEAELLCRRRPHHYYCYHVYDQYPPPRRQRQAEKDKVTHQGPNPALGEADKPPAL